METFKEQLESLDHLESEALRIEYLKEQTLKTLVYNIQAERHVSCVKFSKRTGFPEYCSHYSQDISPILAIRVMKNPVTDGLDLHVRVDDGNGDEFFDPFEDGEIVVKLGPYLAKYLRISLGSTARKH